MSSTPKSLSLGLSSNDYDGSSVSYSSAFIALDDIIIGSESSTENTPEYVIAVIDRSDSKVVFRKCYGKDVNDHIMQDMQPFINKDGEYILAMTTKCMYFSYLPTGPFYQFLRDCGADQGLRTLETLAGNAASQLYMHMRYLIVGIIDKNPSTYAIEAYQTSVRGGELVKSLTLKPIKVGDNYLYTPIEQIIKED